MSQLIQMRQRIKAIETIKKVTHAMRLISMSTHSQLRHMQEPMEEYLKTLTQLFSQVQHIDPTWQNPILNPETQEKRYLCIIIGSQKGLCGSFNTNLFNYFQQQSLEFNAPYIDLISVGKKAIDFSKEQTIGKAINSFDNFSRRSLYSIAHDIINIIFSSQPEYSHVVVFSNELKTFFLQKPTQTFLIPFEPSFITKEENGTLEAYIWEQSPHDILNTLSRQYLEAHLLHLLFGSLLAEHAARFLSMDSSTRNADNLLETTRIEYNKLRQAKITKELTELTGSL